jgi:hypothetical protein
MDNIHTLTLDELSLFDNWDIDRYAFHKIVHGADQPSRSYWKDRGAVCEIRYWTRCISKRFILREERNFVEGVDGTLDIPSALAKSGMISQIRLAMRTRGLCFRYQDVGMVALVVHCLEWDGRADSVGHEVRTQMHRGRVSYE